MKIKLLCIFFCQILALPLFSQDLTTDFEKLNISQELVDSVKEASMAQFMEMITQQRENNREESNRPLNEVVSEYKGKAAKGEIYYIQSLGELYDQDEAAFRDWENPKDWTKTSSLEWYLKAARAGDLESMYMTARKFEQAEDIPNNYAEAFKWYQLVYRFDKAKVVLTLAQYLREGKGVTQDLAKAQELQDQAFKLGLEDMNMARMIGFCFEYGQLGLEQNTPKAKEWYKIAYDLGDEVSGSSLKRLEFSEKNR